MGEKYHFYISEDGLVERGINKFLIYEKPHYIEEFSTI